MKGIFQSQRGKAGREYSPFAQQLLRPIGAKLRGSVVHMLRILEEKKALDVCQTLNKHLTNNDTHLNYLYRSEIKKNHVEV